MNAKEIMKKYNAKDILCIARYIMSYSMFVCVYVRMGENTAEEDKNT